MEESKHNKKGDQTQLSTQYSTKGWNWGYYEIGEKHIGFKTNNQRALVIDYKDVALSSVSGRNEVTLELQDHKKKEAAEKNQKKPDNNYDCVSEIRFFVPNSDLMANRAKEDAKKSKPKQKKTDDKGDGSEEEDDQEEFTPAQIMNEKIINAAGLSDYAGDVIASLPEITMNIPRGKYSFNFYKSFLKLHGSTNDYKIKYKDIIKGFLLPKPDGIQMAYIVQLSSPLRLGQTLHYFLAIQFDRHKEATVELNMEPEKLKEEYGDKLDPILEGPLYDVLSKLFKEIIKKNILIPHDFRTTKEEEALRCSVKASEGHLYPLKSSLIFIHKPVHYIKFNEIKYIEFSRVGNSGMGSSKSFDITITRSRDDSQITFAGIDKTEQKKLSAYLKDKGIRVRSVDLETNMQLGGLSESEEEETPEKQGKVNKKPGNNEDDHEMRDDYDSEEDEDFNEEESPDNSGSESGDESEGKEKGSGSDEEMDEEELKEEVRDLTGKNPKKSQNTDKTKDKKTEGMSQKDKKKPRKQQKRSDEDEEMSSEDTKKQQKKIGGNKSRTGDKKVTVKMR
eukprot:403337451